MLQAVDCYLYGTAMHSICVGGCLDLESDLGTDRQSQPPAAGQSFYFQKDIRHLSASKIKISGGP